MYLTTIDAPTCPIIDSSTTDVKTVPEPKHNGIMAERSHVEEVESMPRRANLRQGLRFMLLQRSAKVFVRDLVKFVPAS